MGPKVVPATDEVSGVDIRGGQLLGSVLQPLSLESQADGDGVTGVHTGTALRLWYSIRNIYLVLYAYFAL